MTGSRKCIPHIRRAREGIGDSPAVSALPQTEDFPHTDLVDRIAKALPPEIRAAYYRELIHCRSLPDNNEMLRILHIMQILTFLIRQAPELVVTEREKIGELCTSLTDGLEKTSQFLQEYQTQLDERLIRLPDEIVKGIQPEVIAARIVESFRQEFVRTGHPQVGQTFLAMNGDFQKGLTAFDRTAHDLKSAHRDSSDQIRAACTQLVQFVHGLVETVIAERVRLSRKYQWLQYSVACVVLIIVFALGRRYDRWKNPPAQPTANIAAPFAEQPAPPAAVPKAPRRARQERSDADDSRHVGRPGIFIAAPRTS